MAQTGWDIAGTDLRRVGYNIDSVAGWDAFPGQRAASFQYGYRHGEVFDQRGFYNARLLPLRIGIVPAAPDGSHDYATTSPEEYVQDNIDDVLGLLHSLGDLTVTRTMPDASVRTIQGRVINAVPVEKGVGKIGRILNVLLRCGYPFWEQTGQQSQLGQTGAFSAANDGNAPINNMVVVFNVAGTLTHDASGDWISCTEAGVTVDVGARTVKNGAVFKDSTFDYRDAWWLQMEPGSNGFTVSGGGDIDLTWYHSWL